MADKNGFHEDFDHGEEIRVGSPRAFGFVFAVVSAIVSLWPLLNGAGPSFGSWDRFRICRRGNSEA